MVVSALSRQRFPAACLALTRNASPALEGLHRKERNHHDKHSRVISDPAGGSLCAQSLGASNNEFDGSLNGVANVTIHSFSRSESGTDAALKSEARGKQEGPIREREKVGQQRLCAAACIALWQAA